MEKRVIVAFAVSMLILVGWSMFMPKVQHNDNKVVTQEIPVVVVPTAVSEPLPVSVVSQPVPLKTEQAIKLPQGWFDISFIENIGAVDKLVFHKYQQRELNLKHGLGFSNGAPSFAKESISSNSISFVGNDQNLRFKKVFNIDNSNYTIGLRVLIQNMSKLPQAVNLPIVLGVLDTSSDRVNAHYFDITMAGRDKTVRPNIHKSAQFADVKFVAMRDRYMCAIIEPPAGEPVEGFVNRVDAQRSEVGLVLKVSKVFPGEQIERNYRVYLGPQDMKMLDKLNPEWSSVIYYGTFDFIAHLLLQLMGFLYGIVHNWGWVIILLGVLIFIVLFPLTMKQMGSMKEMQKLQPKIEALRVTYKDNPQKLNKEIMELYKTHKVNPFSGCLPMILQIPVFFALYQVLTRSIALKGADFWWIKDLSEPDRLFTLGTSLPIIGKDINILPILMAIGMYVQQKISTVAASAEAAQQQKIMAIILPFMFGFMFYHMPAGLVLYWFVNSTLMLLYQIKINRSR